MHFALQHFQSLWPVRPLAGDVLSEVETLKKFILLLGALLFAAPSMGAERFTVLKPDDEAHKLLPKTCEVCHKDANFQFFLVASKDAKQLKEALQLLSIGSKNLLVSGAPEGVVAGNPHAQSNCLFCHLSEPPAGAPPEELTFRTITGTTVGSEGQEDVCRLCHSNLNPSRHPKVYSSKSRAIPDLAVSGIKIRDDKLLCTSCHDMHRQEATYKSLDPKLKDFYRLSTAAFPHGQKLGCLACHPSEQQGAIPRFIESDPIKMCVRCHGTEHAAHRYGMSGTEKTYPMDFLTFPLDKEGRVGCTTCHDEPCTKPMSSQNPSMLRGGPYSRIFEMCEKCHPTGGKMALNPHKQVGGDGKVVASVCNFCHVADPWEGEYGPGKMAYRKSSSELCLNCHKFQPHPSKNHLVKLGDKHLSKLREYEERHKVKLPLGRDNQVNCYTCHNPHGKGVLTGIDALGAEENKALRIPSFSEICVPCHGRFD